MNKLAIILAAAIVLAGCDPTYREPANFSVVPPELSDCKVYWISNGYEGLYVVRCPNSQTSATWRSGKIRRTSVTIES
jgi:hypothetical protein